MKKLLVLMLVLMLALSLAACAGGPEASAQDAPADITLVTKEANYTSLLVPSDFGEFYDQGGYGVAEGTNASIVVTPTIPADVRIEEVTEEYILDLLGDTYSNVEVLAFENPVTIGGVDAVSLVCTGDGATNGKNKTICHITLFFSLEGQDCSQQIVFTYETGANTSLEANIDEIIGSIYLG